MAIRDKEGGVIKTYERVVRSRDEGAEEDRERAKGVIYGCSSFFLSDIRFFLAASIS